MLALIYVKPTHNAKLTCLTKYVSNILKVLGYNKTIFHDINTKTVSLTLYEPAVKKESGYI